MILEREMTNKDLEALTSLRALIDDGVFTGTTVRRLVLRISREHPDKDWAAHLIDSIHIELDQAAYELKMGAPPFSLDPALDMIDDLAHGRRSEET